MPRNAVRYSLDFNLLVFENPVHQYISQGFLGHPKRWYRARIVHDRTFIVFNYSKSMSPTLSTKNTSANPQFVSSRAGFSYLPVRLRGRQRGI